MLWWKIPAEQENVATTTIKTCQKIQDHLKNIFAMLKPIATSIHTKNSRGSNFKQTGWDFSVLSVVAFSKNHAKMMGSHKSLQNLPKLPTIVIFTITMSILVKASIFTTAPATANFKQTGWDLTNFSVVAFSKNHAKMMGCHKSLQNLSNLPTIVIFTITMSILVTASIPATAPATSMRSQDGTKMDQIYPF